MSRFGLMADRAMAPNKIPVLVDLGRVDDKSARDCADRLMAAGVSRKNFSIEGAARLLVKLPPRKSAAIIKRFRFRECSTYFQCTHCRAALAVRAS